MSMLRDLWTRLTGTGKVTGEAMDPVAAAEPPVEYKGYHIVPAPYQSGGQYQTSGTIKKDFPSGTREHRFVRAESHPSRDEAVEFTLMKARQIIDQQGDRLFDTQ